VNMFLVFDVDDTLYLEREYVRSGFNVVDRHLAEQHEVFGFGTAAWTQFQFGVRGTIFDEALRALNVAPRAGLINELVQLYRSHMPSISIDETDVASLQRLGHDHSLGVITDGPAASQRAKVAALGIDDWSSITIVTDELGRDYWKPHPRSYEMVMEHSGWSPERHVYVADNPTKDFIAPTSLGWTSIRLRQDNQLHSAHPSGCDVHAEIGSLDELEAALERLA